MSQRLQLQLEATRELSPSVRHLLFSVDGSPTRYKAGQSIDLHVPAEGELHRRAYSIACAEGVHEEALNTVQPTRVFICGPSHMTHAVERLLLTAGFPESGILLEEYDS